MADRVIETRVRGVDEPLTEDLLERLLASDSPEAYLDDGSTIDRTLAGYLGELLERAGLNRSQLARSSGVDISFVYDIFSGKSRPHRDNALLLGIALGCSVRELQRLLRLAGVSELWPKVRRDAIIIWCVEHRYSADRCDDELYRLGERTVHSEDDVRSS